MGKGDLPHIDRELSWLAFNERVLQEAADPAVPLGERLNFLSIYSSNLDEFFRVRVASLRSLLRLKKKRVAALGVDPEMSLREIHRVVTAQQERFGEIFRNDLVPALERNGISIVSEQDLAAAELEYVRTWFTEHVAPVLESIILEDGAAAPFLRNREVCLVVELWPPGAGRSVGATLPGYALVSVPSPPFSRFLALDRGDGRHAVMFLDDVIRCNLATVFPDHETGNAYAIKMSRDAELYLEDEFSGDIVESIRKSLKRRETGLPCRLLFDLQAPVPVVQTLVDRFDLEDEDLVAGGRYHNLHDLSALPRFGRDRLSWTPMPALRQPSLDEEASILAAVARRDHLLHFPYHRFEYVLEFLEEAARDPDVESIWITLYRVARDSAVAEALIHAAEAGKKVTAFVELKARFDEESNLAWAERMERAGVRTLYSMPGLKVHAKLALVERVEAAGRRFYAWLGTGNFNERTARIYTDLGLLTADPRLTEEVRRVFAFLAGELRHPQFEQLLVAPFNMRKRVNRLIDGEADAARAGEPSGMLLKMNSLEDRKTIDRLYGAAAAGVPVSMIVRGICCMETGRTDLSESVSARSIVDRFLEHARIWIFANGGQPLTYLASADWMTRNLSRRVEVAFPIHDEQIDREIHALIDLQLADNVKARSLDASTRNEFVRDPATRPIRAQLETYRLLRSRTMQPAAVAGPDLLTHENFA
jgi:polyphosphate kinase